MYKKREIQTQKTELEETLEQLTAYKADIKTMHSKALSMSCASISDENDDCSSESHRNIYRKDENGMWGRFAK